MTSGKRALRAPALLALLALPLAALSGCLPGEAHGPLPRDAVETSHSAAVLEPYLVEHPPRRERPGMARALYRGYDRERQLSPDPGSGPLLPPPTGPGPKLPGRAGTPWKGKPRTLPFPPEPPARKPTRAPVRRPVETVRRPARPVRRGVLNPGDELKVTVERHPEFSGEWLVDEDGALEIPDKGAFGIGEFTGESFAGKIGRVSGLKPAEAASKIAERLKVFLKAPPRVTVEVLARREG
ncbi:MAG: polysaccharide biosynthesis/export family protein [Planctomycetota bacterium]|jgi:hypothetical protein